MLKNLLTEKKLMELDKGERKYVELVGRETEHMGFELPNFSSQLFYEKIENFRNEERALYHFLSLIPAWGNDSLICKNCGNDEYFNEIEEKYKVIYENFEHNLKDMTVQQVEQLNDNINAYKQTYMDSLKMAMNKYQEAKNYVENSEYQEFLRIAKQKPNWETSYCRKKLQKILFIPIGRQEDFKNSVVGIPILWKLSEQEDFVLKMDFEELLDRIVLGDVNKITAKEGTYLQLRGKSSKILVDAYDEDGQIIKRPPLAFYLKTGFTENIINNWLTNENTNR